MAGSAVQLLQNYSKENLFVNLHCKHNGAYLEEYLESSPYLRICFYSYIYFTVSGGTPNDVRGTLVEKHCCSDTTRHGMMALVHIAVEALQFFFFFFFFLQLFLRWLWETPTLLCSCNREREWWAFPCAKAEGLSGFTSLIDVVFWVTKHGIMR
jgi:hypothetical protein